MPRIVLFPIVWIPSPHSTTGRQETKAFRGKTPTNRLILGMFLKLAQIWTNDGTIYFNFDMQSKFEDYKRGGHHKGFLSTSHFHV